MLAAHNTPSSKGKTRAKTTCKVCTEKRTS